MNYSVQSILGIFTIDKGQIKILLAHKPSGSYKGYWMLPTAHLIGSLDENVEKMIAGLGLPSMYYTQNKTYAGIELDDKKEVIGISYLCLIDNITYNFKSVKNDDIELEWFDINTVPKTAYDHGVIIKDLYDSFKSKIVNSNILKILFPSDFTLPEVQKIYEMVLNTKLDRRNFRKKLINLGYIVDTGDINEGYTGRPAKLYRFNDEIEERKLF